MPHSVRWWAILNPELRRDEHLTRCIRLFSGSGGKCPHRMPINCMSCSINFNRATWVSDRIRVLPIDFKYTKFIALELHFVFSFPFFFYMLESNSRSCFFSWSSYITFKGVQEIQFPPLLQRVLILAVENLNLQLMRYNIFQIHL